MKTTTIIAIFFFSLGLIFCRDDDVVNTMLKGDTELKEGDYVPFLIQQISPNPFNPTTTIYYNVAYNMFLTLKVYTEDWQEVTTLINGNIPVGSHLRTFDAYGLASGVYYCVMEAEGYTQVAAVRLIK